jgi:plasmid stabilization system protein ParE
MKLNSDYSLELSEEALSDLVDIQNYTFTNYGENQLQKYETILDRALKGIMSFPNSGHSRPEMPVNYQVV